MNIIEVALLSSRLKHMHMLIFIFPFRIIPDVTRVHSYTSISELGCLKTNLSDRPREITSWATFPLQCSHKGNEFFSLPPPQIKKIISVICLRRWRQHRYAREQITLCLFSPRLLLQPCSIQFALPLRGTFHRIATKHRLRCRRVAPNTLPC